jgi:hypothetical protein
MHSVVHTTTLDLDENTVNLRENRINQQEYRKVMSR